MELVEHFEHIIHVAQLLLSQNRNHKPRVSNTIHSLKAYEVNIELSISII